MAATTPGAVQVRNWFGSILSAPAIVVYPRSADEIAQILGDPEHYPGPVRAVGSNHQLARLYTVAFRPPGNRPVGKSIPRRSATSYVSRPSVRDALLNGFYRLVDLVLVAVIRGSSTYATDQQIRYPEVGFGHDSRYTFSIWAFPEDEYVDSLRDYFRFCHDYYRATGYRCNITNVGDRIAHDTSSLFSYSFHGNVITFDPVSTGNPGWEVFLTAYNEFCSQRHGTPLFNQTNLLTREQVRTAFGDRLETFEGFRRRYDPHGRLVNPYFRELLGSG